MNSPTVVLTRKNLFSDTEKYAMFPDKHEVLEDHIIIFTTLHALRTR